jgi:hypothetical protein
MLRSPNLKMIGAAWLGFALVSSASAKPRIITFGRWLMVKWMVGATEDKPVEIKVRALMVNGEAKEFTLGEPHDVTDRVFVIQRAFRLNDSLPGDSEPSTKPQWRWRPGGWLMVQRGTASITRLDLPEFDPYSSEAVWFRDYVAYCGIADGGDKIYAFVVQLGRKKPLLKKSLGPATRAEMPHSECETPMWQKNPARIMFQPKGGAKVGYEIRGFATEIPPEAMDE